MDRSQKLLRSILGLTLAVGQCLFFFMAHLVTFPDLNDFERALGLFMKAGTMLEVLRTPTFCLGLMPPAIVASNSIQQLTEELMAAGIEFSGVIPYSPIKKEVPAASPPDPSWRNILGSLRITVIRPSFSDPLRLRVEAVLEKSLGPLIPRMARLIRGGSYCPDIPILAFEEDHRLVAFSDRSLVISRADHLLDVQIILRCAIDLISSAWKAKSFLQPESEPRQGIGAIEIFKRLPATDCGLCGQASCMEFARCLFTGKTLLDRCLPLSKLNYAANMESLLWLMRATGLMKGKLCEFDEPSPSMNDAVPAEN